MSIPAAWPQILNSFGTPPVPEPSPGQLSSDAGLLPIRQFDECIGLTQSFANALDDPRDPDLTEHTFLEMVRSRVYGILAGYDDQNDHDTLRADPVVKLIADRSPEEDDLAGFQRVAAAVFACVLAVEGLDAVCAVGTNRGAGALVLP
jgi:hypothetical protein